MRRASYKFGVAWLALNDEVGGPQTVEDIASYVTTILLADLFEVEPAKVAADVLKYRAKEHDN